jgi:hypothetical protein
MRPSHPVRHFDQVLESASVFDPSPGLAGLALSRYGNGFTPMSRSSVSTPASP